MITTQCAFEQARRWLTLHYMPPAPGGGYMGVDDTYNSGMCGGGSEGCAGGAPFVHWKTAMGIASATARRGERRGERRGWTAVPGALSSSRFTPRFACCGFVGGGKPFPDHGFPSVYTWNCSSFTLPHRFPLKFPVVLPIILTPATSPLPSALTIAGISLPSVDVPASVSTPRWSDTARRCNWSPGHAQTCSPRHRRASPGTRRRGALLLLDRTKHRCSSCFGVRTLTSWRSVAWPHGFAPGVAGDFVRAISRRPVRAADRRRRRDEPCSRRKSKTISEIYTRSMAMS